MADKVGKAPRAKRLGFGKACNPCRKRKHRCDAARPRCSRCVKRGLMCEYSSVELDGQSVPPHNGSAVRGDVRSGSELSCQQDLQTSGAVNSTMSAVRQNHQASQSFTENGATPASLLTTEHPASITSGEDDPQLLNKDAAAPNGYFGDSSTFRFVSKIRPELQPSPNDAQVSASAFSPHDTVTSSSPYLINANHLDFPPRETANALVDAYFERVHVFYPFLHEGSFRSEYEGIWEKNCSRPAHASWLAVANLVFAYGCEFCFESNEQPFIKRATPFIERAKRVIVSFGFKSADLLLVQALLLLCHYLQGTLELNDCWSFSGLMIRSAFSVGLHLNPTDGDALTAVEREIRKRVWWGCFVLDRTLSMKLGRPPAINLADAEVDLPLEVDDQYITHTALNPRQPSGRPSRISFFVHTIRLSHVIDEILSKLYLSSRKLRAKRHPPVWSCKRTEESDIIGHSFLLDGQLQAWWNDTPLHLKIEPDLPDCADFDRQRKVILIRYLQIRLLLQRPSFLLFSRNMIKGEFMRAGALASSQACVSAATETIRLIHDSYNRRLLNSLWYNLHYIFTSVGVLVTVQTMDKSIRGLLSPAPDPAALECGMDFLRSAGFISILASRYVSLLDRARSLPNGNLDASAFSNQQSLSRNEIETAQASSNGQEEHAHHLEQQNSHIDLSLFTQIEADDFEGINSLNSVFGTGLPQDFLAADWSQFDPVV